MSNCKVWGSQVLGALGGPEEKSTRGCSFRILHRKIFHRNSFLNAFSWRIFLRKMFHRNIFHRNIFLSISLGGFSLKIFHRKIFLSISLGGLSLKVFHRTIFLRPRFTPLFVIAWSYCLSGWWAATFHFCLGSRLSAW